MPRMHVERLAIPAVPAARRHRRLLTAGAAVFALGLGVGLSGCSAPSSASSASVSPSTEAGSAAPGSPAAPTSRTASAPSTGQASASSTQAVPNPTQGAPLTGFDGVDVASQLLPAAPTGTPITQAAPKRVKDTSGIDGVLAWDTSGYPAPGTPNAGTLGHEHVTTPVKYAVTPAVGGPHAPVWLNAGVYTKAVPTERAVHVLEHGGVWITYAPDLPEAQVQQLLAFFKQQSAPAVAAGTEGGKNRWMLMSPWAGQDLPSPIVISAWGHQLRVDSPSDPRLQRFVDVFRANATYSPESAPVDQVPTGTGGNPAMFGSQNPNPAGTLPADAGM